MSRRTILKGAVAGAGALAATSLPVPGGVAAAEGSLRGYAFNLGSKDVTIFDPNTRSVIETKPLGAQVRYLSNQQTFWDGRYIWTYDFPGNVVQAIAIDPRTVTVARTISTDGKGPAHSVMLTPDRKTAWVNIAADNVVAVLDLPSGQVVDKVPTGKFPCDVHFTPDGRFAFIPERDQDTVVKVDLATRKVVKSIDFPAGSKPYMLRVSPDGREVWVQTGAANTNSVLDSATMAVLATAVVGKGPVTNGFQPGGNYGLVLHSNDTFVSVIDRRTRQEVQRIDVGQPQGNVSFSPDGLAAFVTVPAKNEVAVIDMATLAVAERIATGGQPAGLVILDPVAGPENLPAVTPASGSGGPASLPPAGWLLTLGGAAVLAGLRLRLRSQIEYRRLDRD